MLQKRVKTITAEFRRIVEKYARGKATPEEIDFLNLYYDKFAKHPDLLATLSAEDVREIGDRIKHNITNEIFASQTKVGKVIGMRRSWLWAAVFTGLLLSGVLGYLFIAQQDSRQMIITSAGDKITDIAPGGNRAILTLADGTRVVLDSAHIGTITREGNVMVVKLEDGQLAYKQLHNPNQASLSKTVSYNTVSTPRGGQYQLQLSDGSRVWLNAESSIKFPNAFVEKERIVEITGEVYFEVARHADKPFLARAGLMNIKVLGTHFNVEAYLGEGGSKTTLLEGKVEVSAGNNSVVINPGQQAKLMSGKERLEILNNIDIEQVIAWKNGYFSFQDARLKDIMRQIERWYNVEVQYKGEPSSRVFGGGIARNSNLEDVLKILEESNIHFKP